MIYQHDTWIKIWFLIWKGSMYEKKKEIILYIRKRIPTSSPRILTEWGLSLLKKVRYIHVKGPNLFVKRNLLLNFKIYRKPFILLQKYGKKFKIFAASSYCLCKLLKQFYWSKAKNCTGYRKHIYYYRTIGGRYSALTFFCIWG